MDQKRKLPFRGVCTALITPFADGGIDYGALDELIETQIEAGVPALCICGTTGEAVTLTEGERLHLVSHAIRRIGGRAQAMVGVGSPSTARSVEYAAYAAAQGADALLVTTPYYNKGTHDGITAHFHAVADATDLPCIVYNVPARTGVDLTVSHLKEIAVHPRITAVKEASAGADRAVDILADLGDTLHYLAGNDSQFVPTLALGGSGVVSVLSNLLPAEWCEIWQLWQEGETAEAAKRQLALHPLIRLLFSETSPAPIKCALCLAGVCKNELRLPLSPVTQKTEDALRRRMGLL